MTPDPNSNWTLDEETIKADIALGIRAIPGVRIYEEVITRFPK